MQISQVRRHILIKYDKQGYLSQFLSEMFDFLHKVLLEVLCNMSLQLLSPWQHTGFQTSTI